MRALGLHSAEPCLPQTVRDASSVSESCQASELFVVMRDFCDVCRAPTPATCRRTPRGVLQAQMVPTVEGKDFDELRLDSRRFL